MLDSTIRYYRGTALPFLVVGLPVHGTFDTAYHKNRGSTARYWITKTEVATRFYAKIAAEVPTKHTWTCFRQLNCLSDVKNFRHKYGHAYFFAYI